MSFKVKRLFLAAKSSSGITDELTLVQNAVKSAPAFHGLGDLCRWIPKSNFHLTLHFLGPTALEKEQQLVPALARELAECPIAPFSLQFDDLTAFPNWDRAGVLALACRSVEARAWDLHRRLGDLLKALGFVLETKQWVPHITLLRLTKPTHLPTKTGFPQIPPVHFALDDVSLFQSHHTKKGSQYEALADFSLAPLLGA